MLVGRNCQAAESDSLRLVCDWSSINHKGTIQTIDLNIGTVTNMGPSRGYVA